MATATRTGVPGKPTTLATTATAAAAAPGIRKPALSDRVAAWIQGHRRLTSWASTVVVVGALLFIWTMSTKRRAEEIASRNLAGARFAFDNQNLPLAASELAKVIEDYSGTNAAQEGRLLLANVRLLQGQPQQ